MSGPLLEVRHLSTHYVSARGTRVTRAVDDVSLTLGEGEIRFEGEDLLRKSHAEMRRIRGKRIAMILQDPMASLNP